VWIAGIDAEMRRTESMTYFIIVVGLILIVIATAGVTLITTYAISRPIVLVSDALKDISQGEGDLTVAIKISSDDEIGRMARFFNETLEKIKRLVIDIKGESGTLSVIGGDLAGKMNEAAAGVSKITANIQSIRGRVEKQSSSVSNAHANMNRLVANIDKLDDHVEKMSGNVSSSSSAVEEMAANIRSVTDSLNKNSAKVKSLMDASELGRAGLNAVAQDIQEIAKESEGLLEINAVMENISSQTNLLSMNAAIQAAHAGEAGKGFAVVASEIRKLAESSNRQSKTIGDVLKKIKVSIEKITGSTGNVLDKFESIDSGIKAVAQQEDVILRAMEEQEIGSRQIVDGVLEITEIANQVKSGSNEMLESAKEVIQESRELERETGEINSSMEGMAYEAGEINRAVSYANDASNKNRQAIEQLIKGVSRFKAG